MDKETSQHGKLFRQRTTPTVWQDNRTPAQRETKRAHNGSHSTRKVFPIGPITLPVNINLVNLHVALKSVNVIGFVNGNILQIVSLPSNVTTAQITNIVAGSV